MRKMWLRSVGVAVVVGCIAAPAARAGEPAVGLDVGAAIPIDKFQDTADPGGALSPWVGYQFGDAYAELSSHAAEPIQISRPATRPSMPWPDVSTNDSAGSAESFRPIASPMRAASGCAECRVIA